MKRIFDKWIIYIILSLIAIPFLIMYIAFFAQAFSKGMSLGVIPQKLSFSNFSFLWSTIPWGLEKTRIWSIFLNTFLFASISGLAVTVVCTLTGYALSRIEFRGKAFFLSMQLILHAISGQILLIAIFFLLLYTKLLYKIPGVALARASLEIPLGVWMIKGFFDAVPWVDILPVADPNIFSQTQRISMAQMELQLAQSNPQMHDLYQAYRQMYEAVGAKNINAILPPPQQPTPIDPALEEIAAMGMKPFQAFPGQDHKAHIDSHLNFMQSNMVQNSPAIMGALQKNILERISLMAQEQIQLEFQEELQQAQQMQQMLQQQPQNQQLVQQVTQLTNKINSRKAVLISEMVKDYMSEEEKIISELGGDPLLKLKSRELDIKARQNEARKSFDESRISLDTMKAMQNQSQFEDSQAQSEELADLRAETSLTKQVMSSEAAMERQEMADKSKRNDFGRNFKKN